MDIGKVTVQGLFASGVQYVVPAFQRRYVWEQDTQWAPLWQDVADKATELMKQDDAPPSAESAIVPHFLGALVLKHLDAPVDKPIMRLVVDGQQRLTTLLIMTLAIADALENLSNDGRPELADIARSLRDLLVNPPKKGDDRYKLKPFVSQDFEVLKKLVNGEEPSDTHIFVQCHRYFNSEVVEWLNHDRLPERADALVNALFQWVMVVGFTLGRNEDEYVIFEALNARGTPLTEWEKSKNHLLSKSRQTSMGEKEYYAHFIAKFDDDEWWSSVVSLPRFHGSRAELFLNYWLTIQLTRGVQAHRAYYELCGVVKETDLLTMTESLCEYAHIFRQLATQPKDHSLQGLFRYRMDVLGITVVMPLMMKLHHMLEPGDLFDMCAKAIETFLVRRQVTRWSTKEYRRLFTELIKKTTQTPDSTDVLRVLVDGLTARLTWPSDTDIKWSVLQNSASPGVSASRLRMILEAIEDHMNPREAAYSKAPRKLWIEHLMPRKWERYWPLAERDHTKREQDHTKREHAVTTFGNLTLVRAELNMDMKNAKWETKRERLGKDNLSLTNWLLNRDHWDEAAIKERGRNLADHICDIWPSEDKVRQDYGLSDRET